MEIIPATWDMYDLIQGVLQAPLYHVIFEVTLILLIVKIYMSQSVSPDKTVLTNKEKEILIEEWQPEPLVPDTPDDHPVLQFQDKFCIDGPIGKYVSVNGKSCINAASFNFLGMIGKKEIEEKAIQALRIYGVGSCGPRGFYGTMDVHLELEEKLAEFMHCEEAIIYSYGFATIASAIPAYSKRGDIIFADENVNFSVQKGLQASRSDIRWFRHNDMEHLESLLQDLAKEDKKNPKKAKITRRFIVAEGLYLNSGDICPLPKLVELKWTYKVRIFLDESASFGVLGDYGRGVTEHFNIDRDDIDLITASLEHAIGSQGGFCCGKKFIVDHQRLSGQGYCFSASQPPMLASAAIQALLLIQDKPHMLVDLRENCLKVHEKLQNISGIRVIGDTISPVKHLQLSELANERDMDLHTLELVVEQAMSQGVALTVTRYLEKEEHTLQPPSIRFTVNCEMDDGEIETIVKVIDSSFQKVHERLSAGSDMSVPMNSVSQRPDNSMASR